MKNESLWQFNTRSGLWNHVRDVSPDTRLQWLSLFQKDEPAAQFKLSVSKPRLVDRMKKNPTRTPAQRAATARLVAMNKARRAPAKRNPVNSMGEREFATYEGWKRAVKAINPQAKFYGDRDIGGAHGIGDWDGEKGLIFTDAQIERFGAGAKRNPTRKIYRGVPPDYSSTKDYPFHVQEKRGVHWYTLSLFATKVAAIEYGNILVKKFPGHKFKIYWK